MDGRRADAARPQLPDEDRHASTANATIAPLKYKVNVNTLEHVAAGKLELNEIGVCDLELDRPIAFEPYATTATWAASS